MSDTSVKQNAAKKKDGIGLVKLCVRLTLTEEALGTSSASKELHREYIASKAPDAKSTEEEVAALGVDAVDEKGRTVFPRMAIGGDEDVPFVYDYQIKGFFKDAAKMMKKVSGSECAKVRAFKQAIDGLIFIDRRKIPWMSADGTPAHVGPSCERPLRASNADGRARGNRIERDRPGWVPAGVRHRPARQDAHADGQGVPDLRTPTRAVPVAQLRQGHVHVGGHRAGDGIRRIGFATPSRGIASAPPRFAWQRIGMA